MAINIQKASFWKRISAFMCDGILVFFLCLIFMLIFLSAFGYDTKSAQFTEYRNKYAIEYGIDVDMTEEEFNALTPEQQETYEKNFQAANEALAKDKDAQKLYSTLITLLITSISLSLLLSDLLIYFVVPLLLKNGQTLGKKVFGLAVVRTNTVKISNPVLFVRSILGQYAMETIFPLAIVLMILQGLLGIVGLVVLVLFAGLEIFVLATTPTRSSIHDLLSDSVVVDFASQRIFSTEEELLAYKQEEAAELAAKAEY